MSQRLARKSISMPPRTVIGYRKDHSPIFNIAGGSVDAGTEPPAGSAGAPTGDPAGTPEAGASSAGTTETPPPDPADVEKALERMRAADRAKSAAEQRAAELETKIREYEDKDKTELEKAQRDAEEARAKAAAAEESLKRERINNAFLTSNTVQWHNPATALSLLDLSEVTISEDGTVKGIEKAIEALSKSDPYLVKPEGETKGADLPPSGSNVGSGTKGDKGKADRDKLLDKYPALRR